MEEIPQDTPLTHHWRDEYAAHLPGLQGPLPDPHLDPAMARALQEFLENEWKHEAKDDRAHKRRPTRRSERTRTDLEHARIQDALQAYPLAMRSSFARTAVVLTREQARLTSEQGDPRTRAAFSAALDELRSQMWLFDALLKVIGPHADAGAKLKAVRVAKRRRVNQHTSDKAQQKQKDHEDRNAAIAQSSLPASVLAKQYGVSRQHIYRIRGKK
jgi:hypothetical protein